MYLKPNKLLNKESAVKKLIIIVLFPVSVCCGQLIPDSELSFSSATAGATI